ncbi:MAG: phosphoenolpyruvate protein kinase [bacterium]|nr:phosphoenolpyruvate protein kinase [Deltaproteobacteria bacterium]MCP4905857.1 phosphoenolpyruvate protein kinase [bacterium]
MEVATSGPVVRRALVYLVVVGTILVAINHGDALLQGDIDGTRLLKIFLTPLVPYLVSTLSSVSAIRQQVRARAPMGD